jgi:hypothetical protein
VLGCEEDCDAEGGALWEADELCAHTGKPSADAKITTANWRGREPDNLEAILLFVILSLPSQRRNLRKPHRKASSLRGF